MENTIANVTVNGVENQVELQPIIIKKTDTINIIYNCATFEAFQQILNMDDARLLKELAVDNVSQIDASYINIFTIIANGDILNIWEKIIYDNVILIGDTVDEMFIGYAENSYIIKNI